MADPLTTLGAIGIASAINGTDAPGVPAETYSSTTLPDAIVREVETPDYQSRVAFSTELSIGSGKGHAGLGVSWEPLDKISIAGTAYAGFEINKILNDIKTAPSPAGIYGHSIEEQLGRRRLGGSLDVAFGEDLRMIMGYGIFNDSWINQKTATIYNKDGATLNSIQTSIPESRWEQQLRMGLEFVTKSGVGYKTTLGVNPKTNKTSVGFGVSYRGPQNRNRESK